MRRPGITLVESVGVISAIGLMLTLSALLLGRTFDAHRTTLTHLQRMRSLDMFMERLRDDVHLCENVIPGAELRISKAENLEIIYSIINQSVVRTRRQDGQDVGHDHWQLPGKFTATWQIDNQGRIPLLVGKLEFNDELVEFDDVDLVARIGGGGNK